MTFYELKNDVLSVSINDEGAELSSLRDLDGREFLWTGGPVWARHAPVLFPIVGRLPDDRLAVDGREYGMRQHGFARDSTFEVHDADASNVTFVLVDTEETREQFPFPFRLELQYSLRESTLTVLSRLVNTGRATLRASLGAHPGFAWPLPGTQSREGHTIEFERDEPAPIRRLREGLLLLDAVATPVRDRVLELDEKLFAEDALIFDRIESRTVRYSAAGAPSIVVAFPDFPLLGVWSKPPGSFVCIEPWYGMAAPVGFDGDFAEKPGQLALQAGEARQLQYSIAIQR